MKWLIIIYWAFRLFQALWLRTAHGLAQWVLTVCEAETGSNSWSLERFLTCTRSPGKEVTELDCEARLWLWNSILTALLYWFWPSFRGYRKEMWPNPDRFFNLPRHCVFTINSKALILATWTCSWLPTYASKNQFNTAGLWKHGALSLQRPLLSLLSCVPVHG